MAIKQLAKPDKATKSTTVAEDGLSVRCVRTARPDDDAGTLRCVVDWTFDLADVTQAELVTLAARALVIDTQRVWRGAKDRLTDAWGDRLISVRGLIDSARTRTAVDPATAVGRLVPKMSSAERGVLLADLQASIEAEEADADA